MMPTMNGLEACREIRADPALSDVPVILLTARAQDSDVDAGLAVGADEYLTKPFSPRELAVRVDALLERSPR
jgi:DNA-binding response OmpR family regulator